MDFCPRVFWPPVNAIAEEVSKLTNAVMETRWAVKSPNMTKLQFSYCWTPTAPNKSISFPSLQTGTDFISKDVQVGFLFLNWHFSR